MIEQLSLFEVKQEYIANEVLKDLNNLNTIWKDTFYIHEIDLSLWEHISEKDKVLTVIYESYANKEYASDENFIYFGKNIESMKELNNIYEYSELLNKYRNDKDLSIAITPTMVFLYWHRFEKKDI